MGEISLILVVDDDDGSRKSLALLLRTNGYDVQIAETGKAALAIAQIRPVNLTLLDIKLPDIDGTELITPLLSTNPDMEIIMITGYGTVENAVRSLTRGASDYITKPINTDELIRKVHNLLEHQQRIREKRQAEEALQVSEAQYRALFESSGEGILIADVDTKKFLYANPAICRMLGYSEEELTRMGVGDIHPVKDLPHIFSEFDALAREKKIKSESIPCLRKDRSVLYMDIVGSTVLISGKKYNLGFFSDITERKYNADIIHLSNDILQISFKSSTLSRMLDEYVQVIQKYTNCDSVGIRILDEEGNIPFQAYTGYTTEFYNQESYLSIVRDHCMCINVMKGTTDPTLPFYTDGGSFYVNATTKFLARVSEEEKGKTRNICNEMGYESVGVIPIRRYSRITGLIHIADHREDMVPLTIIRVLENAAGTMGEAIDRVQTVEALRESEFHYRTLFENMLEGFAYCRMLYDKDGQPVDWIYLKVNKSFEMLTGFENIDGKRVSEVIPGIKEVHPELFDIYGRVALEGPSETFEIYFKPLDMWMNVSVFCLAREYFVAVFEDITTRKTAQENLVRSEAKYRNLYESMMDGFIQVGMDGVIQEYNKSFRDMVGYSDEELIAKTYLDLTPEKWHIFEQSIVETQILPHGYSEVYEKEYLKKDGTISPIELRAYLIRDENGEPEGMWGIVRDITFRKKMEEEIYSLNRSLEQKVVERTNELVTVNEELQAEIQEKMNAEEYVQETLSLLNAAFDSTTDGLLVVNTDRKITSYNKVFTDIWNIPESIINTRNEKAITEYVIRIVKKPDEYLAKVNELFANPAQESMDVVELTDNRILERYSKPQRLRDTIVGMVWSFRDVTQKKRMEQQITDSLREKEFLLKEIHHRVKNNMQVIASLLYMQSESVHDEKTLDLLKESQNRIRSIALVHEKLYQSRNLSRIDYSAYLEELSRYLIESYNVDRGRITISINADDVFVPIHIAAPLSLIIHEMISNSLKYAFPDGRIGRIRIDVSRNPTGFHLLIQDDGIGIPELITLEQRETMGIQLISGLTKQIDGTISLERSNGTRYSIAIPYEKEIEEILPEC